MDKLKELVERLNKHKYGAEQDLLSALHSVTNILTTISEAEGLPEKRKEVPKCNYFKEGEEFNKAHDLFTPLLHKKTLELAKKDITIVFKDIEIAELKEEIDRFCKKEDFAGLLNTHFCRKDIADSIQAENITLKAKLDKGRIEGILADPTHWCPSKAEQWKRIANAIIEDK